jgi:transcription elongation factor SPT5
MRSFQVLDTRGSTSNVPLTQMGPKKRTKFAVTFDSNSQQLMCDDVVRVIQGPHKGRQGTVKHVYRNFLYIYSFLHSKHSGVMVVRSKHVNSVGSVGARAAVNQRPGMTPAMQSPRHTRGQGSRAGARFQRNRFRNDELQGKKVRVKKGPHKGMIGVVASVTESSVRVELHALMKTITVSRQDVKELNATKPEPDFNDMNGAGGRTPGYEMGGATPFHDGGMTPMTPFHGAGGMTPSHGGAFTPHHDPWAAQTPRHPSEEGLPTTPHDDWDGGNQYSWNPQTPTLNTPLPSTPNPNTPFDATTPNPNTPYEPTSPVGPLTPYDPSTPFPTTPMEPETPYDNYDDANVIVPLPGTVVLVEGSEGIVKNAMPGDMFEVVTDTGVVSLRGPLELLPLPPPTDDGTTCIALAGVHKGETGLLLSVDGDVTGPDAGCVVRTGEEEMIFTEYKNLAVYREL